jgi:hypothetical protein
MAQPAVETLKRALLANGPPILKTTVFDHYAHGKPVNGPRLQTAGRGPPGDVHNTGRALDIMLYARQPPAFVAPYTDESLIGYGLVNIFLGLQSAMKWETMIYDQKEWNSVGTVFPRKKAAYDPANPMDRINFEHLSHIHIDWSFANAATTDFYDALTDAFDDADF